MIVFFSATVSADTIRQMQYNLLYYTAGNESPDDCTDANNNLDQKDAAFKIIVKEVMPDILCVNEIGKTDVYANRILNNVLNTDGIHYYGTLPAYSISGNRSIGNRLFYDTRKFALKESAYVTTYYGGTVINLYKMYYKSQSLAQGDTAFITFIIWHLAAGSSDYNETTRAQQSRTLTNYMESAPSVLANNFVLSGDFNVYTSSEEAYDNLVNNPNYLVRFHDPIGRSGSWNNNSQFADIFTQSTHTGAADCASNGGMDDRFDFILVSNKVKNGTDKVKCLPETYHAFGQDGRRFNGSIVSPANTAVSEQVAQALYTMSDHLPVVMDYTISQTLAVHDAVAELPVSIVNPVSNMLEVTTNLLTPDHLTFEILTIDGKRLHQKTVTLPASPQHLTFDFPYNPAIYLLKITDGKGNTTVRKLVKM
ncbi:MAG: T9SS type A sorting domain-containing protein [Bacteroidales bacterium]|nr:T9SS type A sorting domain-containing protein [Bacteroidales bacterium]